MTAPIRGRLLVVATPLGNLGDLAPRAAAALADADLVCAEDTRRSRALLSHLGLKKLLLSLHRFNEAAGLPRVLAELAAGRTVALVTDGGTPAISDPGHRLVAAAHDAGHAVVPLAGPSSVTAALSVAGFPADRFLFAGFLPARAAARRHDLEALARVPETLVFLEAPHRVLAALDDMLGALGDRPATLCRELTKLHEEVLRAPLSSIRATLSGREAVLGEIVLVVAGAVSGVSPPAADTVTDRPRADEAVLFRLALELEEGDPRRALRRLSRELGRPRAAVKARLLDAGIPFEDL